MFNLQTFQRLVMPALVIGSALYNLSANVAIAQAGEQEHNNASSPNNIAQKTSSETPDKTPENKPKKPKVTFFEQSESFLSDALNGTADPLSGTGTSVSRFNTVAQESLAVDATPQNQNQTINGIFRLNINPALQAAINNPKTTVTTTTGTKTTYNIGNFIGNAGNLTLTGNDGSITNVNFTRTSTNTATISVGNTVIGITVNNFNGTGASISGDPLTTLATLNTGNAGTITINGQPAQVRAGLTGNNGVLQFVGPGGQMFEIRANNVAGYTQADLNKLNLGSSIPGALTFGRIPDH